jgi:hypothetical protein
MSDFKIKLKDYKEFVSTLIEFTDNLHTAKVKTEYWKQYFEIQLFKFSLHSSSLAYLLEGTPIVAKSFKQIKYPDLGSIYLLCRAQIENYLMFYYLNIQPQTFEEGEFKYLLYELSGLTRRQEFDVSIKEQILKKEKERLLIEDIIVKIKNNKYFKELPLSKQNQLLSDRPSRTMGWEKLIECSQLDTEFFLGVWKLYSNYTHSEMIGSIQIKGYVEKPEELDRTLSSTLNQANMLTCIAIKDLVKLFKTSEIIYNTLTDDLRTKIEFWWSFGTGQNRKK